MEKSSVFISIVVGFGVFTFLSIDILRDLYGESALLVVYGVLAILATIAVYSFTERLMKIKDDGDSNEDDIKTENDTKEEEDNEVVEKEMKDLKEKSSSN